MNCKVKKQLRIEGGIMQVIANEVNRNLLRKKIVSTMLEAGKENGLRHAGIKETGHGQTMEIM